MKTIKTSFLFVAMLAAAGCSKKSGPDCAQAIGHGMELSKSMMKLDDATAAKLVDIGVQRCKEDKWSTEALQCMVDAKAIPDAQACYGKLTQEQQTKMNDAAKAAAPH
jgi:hypothetical protein